MSMATLLEPFGGGLECDDPTRNTFDIHGGGIDLVFPHHENEIAQSCCAFGSSRMANVWVHNGFLQVEGEKMAKSLGNFVTIRELLETGKFGDRTWPGDALRLAMLRTHYRQPIDWTVKELERALEDLREWCGLVATEAASSETIDPGVLETLCDDLNTHSALVRVHELAKTGDRAALRASLGLLGFSCDPAKLAQNVFAQARGRAAASGRAAATAIGGGLSVSETADSAAVSGRVAPTVIESKADGTYSTDAETERWIDARIERRKVARAAKDFAEADRIRDELGSKGFAIKDNKDGTTTWEPKR